MAGAIRQVVFPEAQVLQRRTVRAGETVGYNATWVATKDTKVVVINLGYADGYFRGFSDWGTALIGDVTVPVIGRVSMDLVAIDATDSTDIKEGAWIDLDLALPVAANCSGMSQYELLTSLGARFQRVWV
jgi:alanine racemase